MTGRTAVITGGANGIGLAIARRFLVADMNVAVVDVDEQALARARSLGTPRLLTVAADVCDPRAMQHVRDVTIEAFGSVQVLCANAGVGGSSPISAAVDLERWQRILDVNVFGVVHSINAFLPDLRSESDAHIFITASRTGLVSTPYTGAYGASKFAVVALGEMLAAELAEAGDDVAVTLLCPGAVRTELATHGAAAPGADPRQAAVHAERWKSAISADELAEHVHHALMTRQRYVITHEVTIDWMRDRLDAVAADTKRRPGVDLGQTPDVQT
jgi:short-subunit dehydrogenase